MVGMIDSPTVNARRSVQLLLFVTRNATVDRGPCRRPRSEANMVYMFTG